MKSIIKNFRESFNRSEQNKIFASTLSQICLALLDLVGVAIIGFIGALSVTGIQSRQPLGKVSEILQLLKINGLSFQSQVVVLGIIGSGTLLLRTVLSIMVTRKTLFFLGKKVARESSDLINAILFTNPTIWRSRTDQEILYFVTIGIRSLYLGVVGSAISLLVDVFLLILLFIGLLIVDFYVAVGSTLIFGVTGIFLHRILGKRAKTLGFAEARLNIDSNEKIIESISTFREIYVKGRRHYYSEEIKRTRGLLSRYIAEQSFMPNINKYVIETTLIISAVILSSVQFMIHDASHAIAILSIFLAASARLTPAILRIQQNLLFIKGSISSSKETQEFARIIRSNRKYINEKGLEEITSPFVANIKFKNVDFNYQPEGNFQIKKFNLDIKKGEFIAIAGRSGSGKTTLIDLLLGIVKPNEGEILISGLKPEDAISKYPGRIAYVPQQTNIVNGTIKRNITLGFDEDYFPEGEIWNALSMANLSEFVLELREQLEYQVGENGSNFSGGQRQRLGIARALITNPDLLVLDEATSSLDAESENSISIALNSLKGKKTIISIAHRYSTIMGADRIIYIDHGKVLGVGNFKELKKLIPDFEKQARLMGL